MRTDPFTVGIIGEMLRASAEEMFITLGRTSQSPIIYEVLDCACGLLSGRGELIAEAEGVPGFIGCLGFAVRAILDKFGAAAMRLGDIYATNDPYIGGGTHLSDVVLIAPIFFDGELVAFAANKAHWTDLGGMAAGSWTTDATEVYQEGLQLPAIQLYRCPDGTIFTARRPAAVSTYWETGAYVSDLIWRALFPIATDRLPTGHSLSVCGTIVGGVDEERGRFVLVEPQAGGWGATVDRDGQSGLVVAGDGETFIMPVEVCEARYPILVDRFTFNTQTAGAGRFRGGFGLVRDYRITCEHAELTATFGRHRFLPWAAGGGGEGSANAVEVYPAGATFPAVRRGKLARYPLRRSDVARLITGTGGGYGDPLTRGPSLVQQDVRDEFITVEQAREVYGVVIHAETLAIDQAATDTLRAKRQGALPSLTA